MSSLQYSAFFCLDRVARGLDDVSNNRLKYVDVPGIRIPKIPSLFTPESTTCTYALPVLLCNFEFYSCWFCPNLFLGRSWMNLHTLQWTYLSRVFLTPFWETLTMKCIRWDKSHHLQSGLYYNLKIPCWPIQGVTVLKTACLIDFCLSHSKEEKTRLISKLLGTHSTERYFLEKQISFQKLI